MLGFLRRNIKRIFRKIPDFFLAFFSSSRAFVNKFSSTSANSPMPPLGKRGTPRHLSLFQTWYRAYPSLSKRGRGRVADAASYLLPVESQGENVKFPISNVKSISKFKTQNSNFLSVFGFSHLKFGFDWKFVIRNWKLFKLRLERDPKFILKPLRAVVAAILVFVFITQLFHPAKRDIAQGATYTFSQSSWTGGVSAGTEANPTTATTTYSSATNVSAAANLV